jgi:hypothetical protein
LNLRVVDETKANKNFTDSAFGIAALLTGRFLKLLHRDHLALNRETAQKRHGLFCTHRGSYRPTGELR